MKDCRKKAQKKLDKITKLVKKAYNAKSYEDTEEYLKKAEAKCNQLTDIAVSESCGHELALSIGLTLFFAHEDIDLCRSSSLEAAKVISKIFE